jgi:transposase
MSVMGRRFVSAGRDQLFLMPPDVREWLPAGHLAWAVLDAVAGLDLSGFEARYRSDGQGRPAFDPQLMIGLVLYCYCKGTRSSRAVELATFDDVGARVICGGLHPDHATIARFAARHEEPLKGLLVASLAACARQGLVKVDVVAGDGTMVKANASASSNATAAELDEQVAELEALLEAEVARWLAQARAADQADAERDRDDPPGGGGPGTLAVIAAMIARRQQARAVLAARDQASAEGAERRDKVTRAQARAARAAARAQREEAACQARAARWQARAAAKAAAGSRKGPDGRVPVPAEASAKVAAAREAERKARHAAAAAQAAQAAAAAAPPGQASTTDPASRLMPAKKGGYDQLYNVQVLAGACQVILAITTHDNPADTRALHPLLAAGRANLDAAGITAPIGAALFDAGYASDANLTAPCDPDLHVALTRDGRPPGAAPQSWQDMAAKLATPAGTALYKKRGAIVEPVFAQLFSRLGRDLHYRGDRVSLELCLWAASHNYLKAIRRAARPAPA